MTDKYRKLIAIGISFVFFIFGLLTVTHYGINWDTINHLPRGQAYLNYFLTGNKDYSNLPVWKLYWQDPESLSIKSDISKNDVPRRSLYQSSATPLDWVMTKDAIGGHPPLSDILESVFNKIFFAKLGLVNDVDSYRLYGILLASVLVGLVFYWTSKTYGTVSGIFAAISLALYPLFWSESHFNTEKDIPEAVYWSLFLYLIWKGYTKRNWKWILVSGVFFGLALGTKFNILFSIFVFGPWLLFLMGKKIFAKSNIKYVFLGVAAILIGIIIFYASWPFLWQDLIGGTQAVFQYYKDIGLTAAIDPRFRGPFNVNTYPLIWIAFTTPIPILFFSLLGIVLVVINLKKERHLTGVLFFLWLAVPVVRVTLPDTNIYGGVRQIMEYIPAMAIFSGIGVSRLFNLLTKRLGKIVSVTLLLIPFVFIVIQLYKIHPNENVFFNRLAGGLSGAKAINLPSWGNSFGAAYRQGINWVNKNAEPNARLVFTFELMPNVPNIWVRPDILFHNAQRSGFLRKGEYAITLTYQGTSNRSYYDAYLENFLEPVYQAKVDGVAILKVWKNDDEHLKIPWKEVLYREVNFSKEDFGLRFSLDNAQTISKLEINYSEFNCEVLKSAFVRISEDGTTWTNLLGTFPRDAVVPALGVQPKDGIFIEPFVGQRVRYIDLVYSPQDACLGRLKSYKVSIFDGSK